VPLKSVPTIRVIFSPMALAFTGKDMESVMIKSMMTPAVAINLNKCIKQRFLSPMMPA
jgi:hypothetical protein